MADPGHPEHDTMVGWYGEIFEPAAFNCECVNQWFKRIKVRVARWCSSDAYVLGLDTCNGSQSVDGHRVDIDLGRPLVQRLAQHEQELEGLVAHQCPGIDQFQVVNAALGGHEPCSE